MIPQIKLLLLLVNLFLGLGVISFIYYRTRLYHSLYLKFVLQYTIVVNIMLLLFFIFKYFEINILQDKLNITSFDYLPYLFALIYLGALLLVFIMYGISRAFRNEKISKRQLMLNYSAIIITVFAIWLLSKEALENRSMVWVLSLLDNLGVLLPVAECIILVRLYIYSGKLPGSPDIVRSFSLFYIFRYPVLAVSFLFPDPVRFFILIFIVNVFPFIWIKLFVDRLEMKSSTSANRDKKLELFATTHNITAREMEILKLILEGKNNKEIERELYISYHTVKNHVYNIYQKLKINNRYQLISFLEDK